MRRTLQVLAMLVLVPGGWIAWDQLAPVDTAGWLADLDTLEAHTAQAYANLDWTVAQGRVDLPALHARTDSSLRAARTRAAARRALREFGRAFGDGHFVVARPTPALVSRLERMVRGAGTGTELSAALDGPAACARLGAEARQSPSVLEAAAGWRPLEAAPPFPTGLVPLPDGRLAGVMRLPSFGTYRYPDTCRIAWEEFRRTLPPGGACDDECRWAFEVAVADSLLSAEAQRLRSLRAAGAEVLVVDLTGNGGGTDWVDPAARQLVAGPIAAGGASGVRHPHHVGPLERDREVLRRDLARDDLLPGQRALLDSALAVVERALADARTPCDRRPLWRGPLPEGCHGLVRPARYASGILAAPPTVPLDGLAAAYDLFGPHRYRWTPAAWDGPILVLVDGRTASAAEGFAAMLRDAGAALVIGERTRGAGCGYTNGGLPLRLPHSRLEARMPDCARFRADGTNEVAGITPDVVAGWAAGDNAAVRAGKALAAMR